MKAVRIHNFGAIEELTLEEATQPSPAAGQVQINVRAASINPVDWKARQGYALNDVLKQAMPVTLGWDVAGVVSAVGDGVTSLSVGDEVFGMVNFPGLGGSYAEYVVASAEELVQKPANVSFEDAAAIPLVALTAWQALFDAAQLEAGQRVLIHAASGGVGHVAVQLAKWKGAHVIGTASGRNEAYLRELGVDTFINYREADFAQVLRDNPVDVVLATRTGEVQERSAEILKPNGIIVSIVGPPSIPANLQEKVRGAGILVGPNHDQLQQIADLMAAGTLRPTVSQALPLAKAQEAHRLSEDGHVRGKLVLTLN